MRQSIPCPVCGKVIQELFELQDHAACRDPRAPIPAAVVKPLEQRFQQLQTKRRRWVGAGITVQHQEDRR